jgi:hypothetical protein
MCDKYGNYIGEGFADDNSSSFMSHSSDATITKEQYKEMERIKNLDPGYNKIHRVINITTPDGVVAKKRISLELYTSSGIPGNMIRSAIGGAYHGNYRIGKTDEDIFFKVGLATGECKKGSNTLFFDTPEQYEKTFRTFLSHDIKNKWYAKFNAERQYREALSEVAQSAKAVLVR